MRVLPPLIAAVLTLTGVALSSGTARAGRATCPQILAAWDAGRSTADIAQDFGTTRARVAACARLAEQQQHLAAARDRFYARRAARRLPN